MFQQYRCHAHRVLELRRVYGPVRLIAQLSDINAKRLVSLPGDTQVQVRDIGPITEPFRQADSDILRAPRFKGTAQGRHIQPLRDVQYIIRIRGSTLGYVPAAKRIPAVVRSTIVGDLPCGGILLVHVDDNIGYVSADPSDRIIVHKEFPGYGVRYCVPKEIEQPVDICPKGLVLDILVPIRVDHGYHIIATGVFKVQPL